MPNLIDTPPAGWHVSHPQGSEDMIAFFFGVDARWAHELELGERFGVVYSPNPYVHPDSPLRPWCYIVMRVDMCEFRPNHPKERGYVQESRRLLFEWEVQHFEELWLQIAIDAMTTPA